MKYFLGVDFGGDASKATLLSEQGRVVATAKMEYPTHGSTDTRTPAFECTFDDGTAVPQLRYKSHKIFDGTRRPAVTCVRCWKKRGSMRVT